MKVYFLGEIVGEFLWLVFGYICYGVGRLVVPFLTLGRVRVAEARDEKLAFTWYGFARGRDNKPVLSDTFTIIVGLAMLLVLIAAVVWALNAWIQRGASQAVSGLLPQDCFATTDVTPR